MTDHTHKHIPSIERIRNAHTEMSLTAMSSTGDWGHRVYNQSADESCYLCALVIHAERAIARTDTARDNALEEAAQEAARWDFNGVRIAEAIRAMKSK